MPVLQNQTPFLLFDPMLMTYGTILERRGPQRFTVRGPHDFWKRGHCIFDIFLCKPSMTLFASKVSFVSNFHSMIPLNRDNVSNKVVKYSYLEIVFISQSEDWASKSFFFQLSTLSEPFPGNRALCFLDHLVMVTRSSTCTSLTSNLEDGTLCNSSIDRTQGLEAENESLLSGDEWELPSGLIWVAMSLLDTPRDISVPASLTPSFFSSVLDPRSKTQYQICKNTTGWTISLKIHIFKDKDRLKLNIVQIQHLTHIKMFLLLSVIRILTNFLPLIKP